MLLPSLFVEVGAFDFILEYVFLFEKVINKSPGNISVVFLHFVTSIEMALINEKYNGKRVTTDVISVRFSDDDKNISGYVYIDLLLIYMMYKQDIELENTTRKDIIGRLLTCFAHGLLHISGFAHEDEKGRTAMFKKEFDMVYEE